MTEPTDIAKVRTSPKKARTPRAATMPLRNAIAAVAAEYERMSIRQLYYQLVSRQVIPKTEAAYKRVCDISAQMRLDGTLPYRKIADGSRQRRAVYAHSGLQQALENAQELYRRNYWIDQPLNVEVWCEKDALTGVIQPVCDLYGVTFVATRGFPSMTLVYESAMMMRELDKPSVVFYFGDHDASGREISRNLPAQLRQHGGEIEVVRVGLNPDQIARYQLPTRPGKVSDSRHVKFTAQFGDGAVEIDALPPNVLTDLVEGAIISVIDRDEWRRVKEAEELERKTFASIARLSFTPGAEYDLTA